MPMKRNLLITSFGTRMFKRNMGNFVVAGDDAVLEGLKAAPGKKVFYFTASWCPPCKKISPIFEKLSKAHDSLSFVKIDIDDFPSMAAEYSIKSVPTFVFISGSKKVSEVTGAAEPLLLEGIKNLEKSA